jgi:hypothetical protein
MFDKNTVTESLLQSKQCQRNWANTRVEPDDVEFFKLTLQQIPKKQGQMFHHTVFIENQELIDRIYYNAKEEGEPNPHNGQSSAPLLVLFIPYDTAILPSVGNQVSENYNNDNQDTAQYVFAGTDVHNSVGIHSGMLALIANQIGYRTGFCSCFNTVAKQIFAEICKDSKTPLLDFGSTITLGIGHADSQHPHNYDRFHNTLMYRHKNVWNDVWHFCHIK